MKRQIQRAREAGLLELLGMLGVFAAVFSAHAYGLFGVPRAGTTAQRLADHQEMVAFLVAFVLLCAATLYFCKPRNRPVFTLFFAGILAGLALASMLFFDPWLGVMLVGMAMPLYRRGAVAVLA